MFSVLLSVYSKEQPDYLRQSLDSIFTQTLLPDEVILVKDGPLTDELDKVIGVYCNKYPVLHVVALKENQGLGKALNKGLACCSYDIVARMDTDDIAKPDRFEKQISVMSAHPEYDLVGAWIDEFDGGISNIISTRKLPETPSEILDFAKSRCPVNHPVVMFRKSSVMSAGGYQHFPLFEDYWLWIRMLAGGCRFYNIQESLLYFRTSAEMFKRRGGWKYALTETKLQREMLKIGFISFPEFISNIITRSAVRLVPNQIRSLLYRYLLRR